jgi:uncharacterized protein YdeI (YjbR/CyaY-like superfamily)
MHHKKNILIIPYVDGEGRPMYLEEALLFNDRNEWRSWLEKNHRNTKDVWLLHYKKQSKKQTLDHIDAVEEALCFGWIDSKLKKIDQERYILKYSPRKQKSVWSKINKENAEKMIASGKMTQAGLEKIEEAKKHGLWDTAYTNKIKERIPLDLKKALLADNTAWDNFQHFANSYRNMYCGWVKSAKTNETRKRRIAQVVERSRNNKKPGVE